MEQGEMQASLQDRTRANTTNVPGTRTQLGCSLPMQTVGRFSKSLDRSQPCQLCASCPELQQQKVPGMQGGEQKALVTVPRHSQLQTEQPCLQEGML